MNKDTFKSCGMTEGYEVVRTIKVVTAQRHVCRIEILHDVLKGSYGADYYLREAQTGYWTKIEAAWVDDVDLELATHQAVGWLSKWATEHSGS